MAPLRRLADGRVEPVALVPGGGLPLGIEADIQYGQQSIACYPGDALLLYSDGITDAMNAAGEFYGLQRLQAQLGPPAKSVMALGGRLLDDVQRFIGSQSQGDDMCRLFGRTDREAVRFRDRPLCRQRVPDPGPRRDGGALQPLNSITPTRSGLRSSGLAAQLDCGRCRIN